MTTNPRTWENGSILKASDLNSEIRDSLNLFFKPPYALLTHSGDQVVTANTDTAVQWDTEIRDNYNGHSSGANTQYVAPVDGVYLLSARIPWIDPGVTWTGDYAAFFRRNTVSSFEGVYHNINSGTGAVFAADFLAVHALAAGDIVEVMVRTNQASSGVAQGFHDGARWEIQWLRNYPT